MQVRVGVGGVPRPRDGEGRGPHPEGIGRWTPFPAVLLERGNELGLDGPTRLLVIALESHRRRRGEWVFPGIDLLATETGWSEMCAGCAAYFTMARVAGLSASRIHRDTVIPACATWLPSGLASQFWTLCSSPATSGIMQNWDGLSGSPRAGRARIGGPRAPSRWDAMGRGRPERTCAAGPGLSPERRKAPLCGAFTDGHGWFRTSDLSRVNSDSESVDEGSEPGQLQLFSDPPEPA